MATPAEILLTDILSTLREIRDTLRAGAVQAPRSQAAAASVGASEVASDRDLDSQYGNPEIKKDPPRWNGPPFVGCRYSDTTPEYLEEVAGFLDWAAAKDEESGAVTKAGKAVAPYKRKDAARARGWAKRLREGWGQARATATSEPGPSSEFNEPDIPF